MLKKILNTLLLKKQFSEPITWLTENSIYSFISSNIDNNGSLLETGHTLPDEQVNKSTLQFAAGLKDVIFADTASENTEELCMLLTSFLKDIAINDNKVSEQHFYEAVTQDRSVIKVIDPLLHAIADDNLGIYPYLFDFAYSLATKTNHRNSVKLGIAILGISGEKSALNPIKILGLHDEFTEVALQSITQLSHNIEADVLNIAQKVKGWGRIMAVSTLCRLDLLPSTKYWLITEGYKNSIMHEYLAHACAQKGNLVAELKQDRIAPLLFASATEIIDALITDYSPAKDIYDLNDAPSLLVNYIKHASQQAPDVSCFVVLCKIRDLLQLQLDGDESLAEDDWNPSIISDYILDIQVILNKDYWSDIVTGSLNNNDKNIYWNAKQAAKYLKIDIWPAVWSHLQAAPLNQFHWYDATMQVPDKDVSKLIQFASDTWLSLIQTQPAEGKDYAIQSTFSYLLTFLEKHPERGIQIIEAAQKYLEPSIQALAEKTIEQQKIKDQSV